MRSHGGRGFPSPAVAECARKGRGLKGAASSEPSPAPPPSLPPTPRGEGTSGGPSPTLGKNIAMGYVSPAHAALGTELKVIVRGKTAAAEVVAMPFVAQRYYRKPKA